MVDLTSEQGIRAAKGYLYHKYIDDEVAKLMDISLCTAQLESGHEEQLLLHPRIKVKYLTNSWIKNLQDFLGSHKMQIEISNPWSPHTSCKHNAMIMPEMIKHGVSPYKQFHINACRMYLQVSMLSNIATADGTGIRPEIMECL